MQSVYRLLGEKRVAVTTATGASLAENWEAEHACPLFSNVDLLGHRKRVVDLDPEITHSALDLRMA